MLELTKKADYALRLMIQLADAEGAGLSTAEVSRREDIPHEFLRKVGKDLVTAGLLSSSRGAHGGLRLAQPAQTITLLEIVRAVDEPVVSKCVIDPNACTRRSRCAVYPVWRRLRLEMERAMEQVLLSELVERHRLIQPAITRPTHTPRPSTGQMAHKETPEVPIKRGNTARPRAPEMRLSSSC